MVGPGFDASDILRGDLQPHERWEVDADLTSRGGERASAPRRAMLATPDPYVKSVQRRLAKIGARTKNPAFPDVALRDRNADQSSLIKLGTSFLRSTRQTLLLKHMKAYRPISEKHVVSFSQHVQSLLSGLSEYGIHLGPSSFAASIIPKRGLIFWDFFPARKQEVSSLYPQH